MKKILRLNFKYEEYEKYIFIDEKLLNAFKVIKLIIDDYNMNQVSKKDYIYYWIIPFEYVENKEIKNISGDENKTIYCSIITNNSHSDYFNMIELTEKQFNFLKTIRDTIKGFLDDDYILYEIYRIDKIDKIY